MIVPQENKPNKTLAPAKEPENGFVLTLHERIMYKNDSYKYGRKIKPTGIMVHSTAAPGVMAAAWYDRWNRSFKMGETSRKVSVHAFVDDKGVWQYLPWDQRAWHAAGKANDSCIAFEMCEPKGHHYKKGSKMHNYDVQKNEEFFRACWQNAVQLCVMLCQKFEISAENIIGHCEGYGMGIANNHGDPGHWFPQHGENMDSFRAAVRNGLGGNHMEVATAFVSNEGVSASSENKTFDEYIHYVVEKGDTLWGISRDRLGTGKRYKEIIKLNNLANDVIRVGQCLKIPE